jgi:hypothetical protein
MNGQRFCEVCLVRWCLTLPVIQADVLADMARDADEALEMVPLAQPRPCGILSTDQDTLLLCGQLAQWAINDLPVCQEDLACMAEMNSDNAAFLAPAFTNRQEAY